MNNFIDHMMVVCLAGATIGLILLVLGLILEGLNKLTNGKLQDKIVSFFSEE